MDRSLVVVDHARATRYRMLETIRQYAADQLAASGETVALRDRHLSFFHRFALDAEDGLAGPDSPVWLGRLDAEIDNIRSALDWALETRPEAGLEMCVAMTRYWQARTMGFEGHDRVMQAIDRVRALPSLEPGSASRVRSGLIARALSSAGVMASMGGLVQTISHGEDALAAARESGDPAAIVDAIYVWLFRADPNAPAGHAAEWHAVADEGLAIATDLGDWGRLSRLQLSVAMIEAPHDLAAAEVWLEQATDAAQRSGNPQDIAYLAQVRGRVASFAGRYPEAQRWYRESQVRFHAVDDQRFELSARSELGHALRHDGRIDEAEAEYRESIRGWQRSGNRGAVANQLESFAFVAVARGDGVRATRLLGAAEALRDLADARMTPHERVEYEAEIVRVRQKLDEDAFESAWAEGRRMTADEAVAFALSE